MEINYSSIQYIKHLFSLCGIIAFVYGLLTNKLKIERINIHLVHDYVGNHGLEESHWRWVRCGK